MPERKAQMSMLMAGFGCLRPQGKALKSARSELEQATQQKVDASILSVFLYLPNNHRTGNAMGVYTAAYF